MNNLKCLCYTFVFLLSALFFSCKQNRTVNSGLKETPYNDIIEREKYEFDLLKNPLTGKIPAGVIEASLSQAKQLPLKENLFSPLNLNVYTPAGPNNLGGRTRAFAYDVRYNGTTNRVIIAGSVSSGVMRSTDGGTSWTRVNGTANIHDISCLAQDTRAGQQDTWYLGTGEALGNTSSGPGAFRFGNGIYKSVDNGLTWTRLPNSNTGVYEVFDAAEDLIVRIVVDPTNGNVYAACLGTIIRSTDGGTTWANVLSSTWGSTGDITDIVCSTTGVLYAAFAGTAGIGTSDGVWRSTTGNMGAWTHIAGNGTIAGWKASGTYGRVVLALAPSNQNIVYVLYDNKSPGLTIKGDFFKYDAGTATWSANRSANLPNEGGATAGNDPFDSQGGYDLVVAVKPNDENFVIIGGTNAYRSTDGFVTNTNYQRIGGYASAIGYTQYANHHPDVHTFVFEPGSNIKMICGDDGGIHVTADVTALNVSWSSLNNNYVTYQYYYTAIDPTTGSTKYLGGAQDNGTTYRGAGTNNFSEVYSGDGVSVGISSANTWHYCGSQNGDIERRDPTLAPGFVTDIKPAAETNQGIFVTLFYLNPDNTEDLWYANNNRLWRTTIASTVTTAAGWTNMTGVSATVTGNIRSLATTRGTYNATHNLFFGTSAAKIYRITDPRNAAAATVPTDITPAGITAASTVIGLATASDNKDTIMAVISNYGVPSVFWTGNATAATPTWYNVEGTGGGKLDLPSFRSVAIIGKLVGGVKTYEYYVGTSVGLFSTTSIVGTSQATADATSWVREGTGTIDQAVVTSLPIRNTDNTMLIGTHGNGMFVANIASALPVSLNSFDAVRVSNTVRINWSVGVENNIKHYTVERKYSDETLFTPVGSVSPQLNNIGLKTYNLTDNSVVFNRGNIQYRLKITNLDNKIDFSKIVSVRASANDFITNVYPTLVKDNINIIVGNNSTAKSFKISIVGADGRILFAKEYEYKNTIVTANKLPAGTYYLVISNGKEKFVSKFVKQ